MVPTFQVTVPALMPAVPLLVLVFVKVAPSGDGIDTETFVKARSVGFNTLMRDG